MAKDVHGLWHAERLEAFALQLMFRSLWPHSNERKLPYTTYTSAYEEAEKCLGKVKPTSPFANKIPHRQGRKGPRSPRTRRS